MTEEEFTKYSYRHSEAMVYHRKRPRADIDCMLIGVDFDNHLFHLYPFDQETYVGESYWVPCENVDKKIIITMKLKKGEKQ